MVNKAFYLKTSKLVYTLALMIVFFSSCTQSQKSKEKIPVIAKNLKDKLSIEVDSLKLPFIFYPERWFLNNNQLYVLNNKDSSFLSIFDLYTQKLIQWGKIGNGPNEYIIPSLCRMKKNGNVGIYSNALNIMNIYQTKADSLIHTHTFHFPIWSKEHGIPKSYTRMQQYDDSLFIGTSFMPKEIAVELLNLKTEKVVDAVDFSLKPSENDYSGPYECKISVSDNYMAIAYRYINRLEVYQISSLGFNLKFIIGDDKLQNDLYNKDQDDEMIYYYSDVICGKNTIYAIYQGTQVQNLSNVRSSLEIYNLEGENLNTINLGRYISDIVIDETSNIVYACDKNIEDDYLYYYQLPPS